MVCGREVEYLFWFGHPFEVLENLTFLGSTESVNRYFLADYIVLLIGTLIHLSFSLLGACAVLCSTSLPAFSSNSYWMEDGAHVGMKPRAGFHRSSSLV